MEYGLNGYRFAQCCGNCCNYTTSSNGGYCVRFGKRITKTKVCDFYNKPYNGYGELIFGNCGWNGRGKLI